MCNRPGCLWPQLAEGEPFPGATLHSPGRTLPEGLDYEARVEQMAIALHGDCLLEWQAIAVVDPGRGMTMHGADAHYGKAHDLVRRIWPELDLGRVAAPRRLGRPRSPNDH